MDLSMLEPYMPYITGLLMLIIGYFAVVILSPILGAGVTRLPYMDRFNQVELKRKSTGIFKGIGFIVLLMMVLDALKLTTVLEPLSNLFDQILGYAPRVLGTAFIVAAGWFIANFAKKLTISALDKAGLDEKINSKTETENAVSLTQPIGQLVLVLVLLPFLSLVLNTLSLTSILEPVNNILNSFMGFIPNLFGAALIVGLGYVVACIVRSLSTNALSASFSVLREKVQVEGVKALLTAETAGIIGQVIFAVILFPLLVQGVDVLGIESISAPTKQIINQVLDVVPNILAGSIFLTIVVAIATFVKQLVQPVLSSDALKTIAEKVSGSHLDDAAQDRLAGSLSQLIFVAIIALSASQALNLFGLGDLGVLASSMIDFGGHILIGLLVFVVGLALSNLAVNFIQSTQQGAYTNLIAGLSRGTILFLFGAMALRQMGIANQIIEVGFTLLLGAAAVAFALAVGLGGRDVAGKHLDRLMGKLGE